MVAVCSALGQGQNGSNLEHLSPTVKFCLYRLQFSSEQVGP
jgi:hypothetical protein